MAQSGQVGHRKTTGANLLLNCCMEMDACPLPDCNYNGGTFYPPERSPK